MNYFKIKKIINSVKQISLSKEDKTILEKDFLKKINFDLQEESFSNRNVFAIPVAVLTILLVVSPLAYASEFSIPGDMLYPVKEKINEPIKRVTNKISGKDSLDFEVDLLDKKIEDSEKVLNKKNLSEDKVKKVKETINIQFNKVEKKLENNSKKIKENKKKTEKETKSDILDDSEKKGQKEELFDNENKKVEEKISKILEEHKNVLKKLDLPSQSGAKLNR